MRWLLWKEYRQNRLIVFVTLGILMMPYLLTICIHLSEPQHYVRPWRVDIAGAGMFGLILGQLALALIGGNVIAGERYDRSAEFQVYLPIPRSKLVAAKLLLSLAIATMIWLPNGCLLWALGDEMINTEYRSTTEFLGIVGATAATGLAFFCIGWFFSSILKSPATAVIAGLLVPAFLWFSLVFVTYLSGIKEPSLPVKLCWFAFWLIPLPVCFGMGTWLYLRRVEP